MGWNDRNVPKERPDLARITHLYNCYRFTIIYEFNFVFVCITENERSTFNDPTVNMVYELQPLVESVKSAQSYGEKLQEIFSECITLYATDKLADVREVVFSGE